jgi:hypothetical protein
MVHKIKSRIQYPTAKRGPREFLRLAIFIFGGMEII